MKHSIRLTLISSLLLATGVANAGWSANVGWASDYYFRGILQSPTSPSGGVDYESDTGFYVGTWAADVYDGLEVDGYFGYGGEAGDFSYGIGMPCTILPDVVFDQVHTKALHPAQHIKQTAIGHDRHPTII